MRKPYILMSLLVLSTLLSACSTVSGSPASQSAPAPDEVLATSIGTYENRTLLVPDGRLALTALHKGKDYQGKPMFYVLFELTNTTEKTQNNSANDSKVLWKLVKLSTEKPKIYNMQS